LAAACTGARFLQEAEVSGLRHTGSRIESP